MKWSFLFSIRYRLFINLVTSKVFLMKFSTKFLIILMVVIHTKHYLISISVFLGKHCSKAASFAIKMWWSSIDGLTCNTSFSSIIWQCEEKTMLCKEMNISVNRCHLLIHANSLICCYSLSSVLFDGVLFEHCSVVVFLFLMIINFSHHLCYQLL